MAQRGHGEGTISKRKDGRWTAAVSIPGSNGKRKWLYGVTRRDVQQKLNETLQLQQQGRLITAPTQTLEHYLRAWLKDTASVRVSPTTYVAYETRINRVIPLIGKYRLNQLKSAHIQNCYATLLATLSPRSVQGTHSTLRQALQQAVDWDLLAINPANAVTVPRVENPEMRTLTAVEVLRLIAGTRGEREHPLWVVLATTGLRLGEALGLKWVDVADTVLTVRRTLHPERGKGLVLVEPKTRASRRSVHLTRHAVDALAEHRKQQLEDRLKLGPEWNDLGFVFSNGVGQRLQGRRVLDTFSRTLRRLKLPSIRIHDLRHTVATLQLQQGIHPRVVQEMLGHSSIVITLGTYSHVIPTMHKDAADRMEQLLTEGVV